MRRFSGKLNNNKSFRDEYCYVTGTGEFSIRTAEAFDKHLKRLKKILTKIKDKSNPEKVLKIILLKEQLWDKGCYATINKIIKEKKEKK